MSSSVASAATISFQLANIKLRLDEQESQSKANRSRLHQHAEKLNDSASIVELEASSLVKADRSQLHNLINNARKTNHLISEKISPEQLTQKLLEHTVQRRIAMKSIQKEMNQLKNRFNGSVNDLVLEFGKNIKHELDQRPTSKQIETTVENLKIRIRLLEQGKGKSKNRRRNRNGDGDSDSSELKDSTSMLRFDDHGSENNDNESDENEDDNDEEDDSTTNETSKRKL